MRTRVTALTRIAALKKERDEALAEVERLQKELTRIADPTYVGNYSDAEVVEIYRKWAALAVARSQQKEA